MIAHVAEAGEDRGRVVLQLGMAGALADVAIEAAVRVAQAFQSEIESLVVEDQQLVDLASYPFAREISLSGTRLRDIKASDIERDMRLHLSAMHRRVARAARAADVQTRSRIVRDSCVQALVKACAERGPWNVVTLGETFDERGGDRLAELFASVEGTTGFVLTGPKAHRTHGAVIALVEGIERVPPMLRAAERLASASGVEAQLWLVDNDEERLEWMDGQARLALDTHSNVHIDTLLVTGSTSKPLAAKLKQVEAGFVIARFGGRLAPPGGELDPVTVALECPLLLVR